MGEREGGSSSASPDEHRDAKRVRCTNCGGAIDKSDWYPVTQERDEDGNLQIHPFCDEECQAAWLDEQSD